MDRLKPIAKSALHLLNLAWIATVLLAGAAVVGISLPAPFDQLSDGAFWLFEHVFLTLPVFIPVFIVGWYWMNVTLSKQSGWTELAKTYGVKRAGHDVRGAKLKSIGAQIGDVSSYGVHRIGATREGIVLASHILFRPGTPKLMLPWSVVQLSEANPEPSRWWERLLLGPPPPTVCLKVATHPDFEMQIPKSDFDKSTVPQMLHDAARNSR